MKSIIKTRHILLFILTFAFVLRFYNIGERGLAGDEKYSLLVSQFVAQEGSNQLESLRKPDSKYFTPKEFWANKNYDDFLWAIASRDNGSGAPYALVAHYTTKVLGISDTSMRLPSLIFNLLTIFILFCFIKTHLNSEKLALFVCFLAAISPFYIIFSQVARNYSMLFFFALFSTHLFLLILRNEEKNIKNIGLFLAYGISVWVTIMCHFSVFPLFFIHGLFVLLYIRKLKTWIALIITMTIPLIGMLIWLNSNGGKWLVHSMNQSSKVYNQLALMSPNDDLSQSTFFNIFKQLRHTISTHFILIDGFRILYFSHQKMYLFGVFIFLISFLIYTKNFFTELDKNQKKIRVFIFLLSILPLLFLILFAIQDKNTFRIMPRYVGFSYSFSLILIGLIVKDVYHSHKFIKYPLLAIFCVQLLVSATFIDRIYQDSPPSYFQTFDQPRTKNPYKKAADLIIKSYAKGDTILYPSYLDDQSSMGYNMYKYSVQDAQYLGFYLPKDSEMIQRINQTERNKTFIKKPNGTLIQIFDFQETRFRY